jgi:hypothetical protein
MSWNFGFHGKSVEYVPVQCQRLSASGLVKPELNLIGKFYSQATLAKIFLLEL